jgi:hypothetical protein
MSITWEEHDMSYVLSHADKVVFTIAFAAILIGGFVMAFLHK